MMVGLYKKGGGMSCVFLMGHYHPWWVSTPCWVYTWWKGNENIFLQYWKCLFPFIECELLQLIIIIIIIIINRQRSQQQQQQPPALCFWLSLKSIMFCNSRHFLCRSPNKPLIILFIMVANKSACSPFILIWHQISVTLLWWPICKTN